MVFMFVFEEFFLVILRVVLINGFLGLSVLSCINYIGSFLCWRLDFKDIIVYIDDVWREKR